MTRRTAVLQRALVALVAAGGLLAAAATPVPAAAQTAGATSTREPFRMVRGQPYTSEKSVFCVNRPALDTFVAMRRSGDLYTLSKGCFVAKITYLPEKRVPGVDYIDKTVFFEQDSPDGCTLKTGEKKNCRIKDIMKGFVQALMEYRGNMIQIYVQVDADLIVVEPK